MLSSDLQTQALPVVVLFRRGNLTPFHLSVSSAHTQRLLKLQSILRRAPSYRTLELQLIEWQERELFEYFVVVSLKKKPSKNSYSPEVTYQFPKVNAADGKNNSTLCSFHFFFLKIQWENCGRNEINKRWCLL